MLIKPLDRRKATRVRKSREARRERRTILRLASLLSRRMVAGFLVGGNALSLSTHAPIMVLCNNEGRMQRSEKGRISMKRETPGRPISFDRKLGECPL